MAREILHSQRDRAAGAHAGRPAPAVQCYALPGPGGGDFGRMAIDPQQIGLTPGGGTALPGALLARMETAFATDFAAVRVHVGPQPARLGAIALATGDDLYFAPAHYQPDSPAGARLIGHELAHVVQQRQGRVPGPASGISVVEDQRLEAEAERQGERAAAMPAVPFPHAAQIGAPGGPRGAATPARTILPARAASTRRAAVVQRAGDKIAFIPGTRLEPPDQELVEAITKLIADEKNANKAYKDQIESDKDKAIDAANALVGSEEDKKTARIRALHTFEQAYQVSGWDYERLTGSITKALGAKVAIDKGGVIKSKTSGAVVYRIVAGNARFGAKRGDGSYVKLGTNKEYVKDAYGVFVNRYVQRGCSKQQMKQLFVKGEILPRNTSMKIGKQGEKYDFGERGPNDLITQAEREFLQQRDGSGPNQRLLSVTRNLSRKVYSNHGELFTDAAVIEIDLAKIDARHIFDIHSEETHARKVSLENISDDAPRDADKEMQSYIYSATKNREILLEKIPLAAVTKFTVGGKEVSSDEARSKFDKKFAQKLVEQEKARREKAERNRIAEEQRLEEAQAAKRRKEAEEQQKKEQSKQAHAEKKKVVEQVLQTVAARAAELAEAQAIKFGIKAKDAQRAEKVSMLADAIDAIAKDEEVSADRALSDHLAKVKAEYETYLKAL